MSSPIVEVAGIKQTCSAYHWRLVRVSPDGAPTPLFQVFLPGPMGIHLRWGIASEDPAGANIQELDTLLYCVRKAIDANFNDLHCESCRDDPSGRCGGHEEVVVYSGQDPDYDAIAAQYEKDLAASSIEEIVPYSD